MFKPIIQKELDQFVEEWNNHRITGRCLPRRNVVTGVPNDLSILFPTTSVGKDGTECFRARACSQPCVEAELAIGIFLNIRYQDCKKAVDMNIT